MADEQSSASLQTARRQMRSNVHVSDRTGTDVHLNQHDLPTLLTVDETASLLRTSRKAIYAMAERAQLPGATRIGRRLLVRSRELLDWLDQKGALSLKENKR